MEDEEEKRALLDLSPSKAERAREAIEFLSSLPGPSGSAKSTLPQRSSRQKANTSSSALSRSQTNLEDATTNALCALRALREGNLGKKRKSNVVQEIVKKKRGSVWRHNFYCLAYTGQTHIPVSESEKDQLRNAGLGSKDITLCLDASYDEFQAEIIDTFPQLRDGGGYRFLKGTANSKTLTLLSHHCHKSPRHLKESVGKRTYIRPVQKDLDLTPIDASDDEEMTEVCLTCDRKVPLAILEDHIITCNNKKDKKSKKIVDSIDLTHDGGHDTSSSSENEDLPRVSFKKFVPKKSLDELATEESLLSHAVTESSFATTGCSDSTLMVNDIFMAIKAVCTPVSLDVTRIEVRRSSVLQDGLKEVGKPKFKPCHTLKVSFVGEGAVDCGGPRREFFRLVALEAKDKFFTGGLKKFFLCDIMAIQRNDYFNFGCLMAISVIQGGGGMPFLHDEVYQQIIDGTKMEVKIADLPDGHLSYVCKKLEEIETDEEMKVLLNSDEVVSMLHECGYRRPISSLTLEDKSSLSSLLINYHLFVKPKAAVDQFLKGLETLNVLTLIKKYPVLAKPYFVNVQDPLTADEVKHLFTVQFSELGTNVRLREEQTWVHFTDFIDECEEGNLKVALKDLLSFVTGSCFVPPEGFPVNPCVIFNNQTLCTATTCDMTLKLPLYEKYDDFKEAMTMSVVGNDGLGAGP